MYANQLQGLEAGNLGKCGEVWGRPGEVRVRWTQCARLLRKGHNNTKLGFPIPHKAQASLEIDALIFLSTLTSEIPSTSDSFITQHNEPYPHNAQGTARGWRPRPCG